MDKTYIDTIRRCGVLRIAQKFTKMMKVNDGLYQGRCPHPDHHDSTPSFCVYVNNKTGIESWCCMGCHTGKKDGKTNFGSDNIAFVIWMSHNSKSKKLLTFKDAIIVLAKFYGIAVPQENPAIEQAFKENYRLAGIYYNSLTKEVIGYLHGRGLDDADILKWKIGYKAQGAYPGRITFPIENRSGKICGFSNREFTEESKAEKRKYINSPTSEIFSKKNMFYGIQHYNFAEDHILITEGQFDTILAHKYGVDIAVATMCCHLSDEQIQQIKSMNKIPILCYDGDASGQNGINSAIEKLYQAGITSTKVLILPKGLDLAEVALLYKNDLPRYIMKNVKTFSQYRLEDLAAQFDAQMTAALEKILPQVNQTLQGISNPNESILAKNFIKKRLHLWAE